jgi:ribosomal protein L11 methyltransferase
MDTFWLVTIFHFPPVVELREEILALAMGELNALGVEEFSLDELTVDQILGDRSYSGGDLPQSVLDEVEQTVLSVPINVRFFFQTQQEAIQFKKKCQEKLLAEIQMTEHPSEDWNAQWKKHYVPIRINPTLEIVPSWMMEYESSALHRLYIHPGMGFGTGSHETTFLCLKLFMEEISNTAFSVLDFGSGSGILGLAALKLDPTREVDFYDIDPEANKNCFENAQLNHLQDSSFRLLLPDFRDQLKKSYDLVFANILESILLFERDYLVRHTAQGGSLILSGLLRHQVPAIIAAFADQGVELKRQSEMGDWAALLFVKGVR